MAPYLVNLKTGAIFANTAHLRNRKDLVEAKTLDAARKAVAAYEQEQEPDETPEPGPAGDQDVFGEGELDSILADSRSARGKAHIEALAWENFGVKLDRRKKLATLKKQLADLVEQHRGE